jgi:hypothetical protein
MRLMPLHDRISANLSKSLRSVNQDEHLRVAETNPRSRRTPSPVCLSYGTISEDQS